MASYKLEFSVCGKSISSAAVTPTNGVITYAIPQDVMIIPITETVIGIQVIGHNGETIIKSPIIKAHISNSLQDSNTVASDSPVDIETRVEQLEAVKHTHANKAVLDKFAEKDGKPTYDGNAIGGGTGGASTAADVSYELPEEVQTEFPEIELEENTVKAGLDLAMYYALVGMYAKYIQLTLQGAAGTVDVSLQDFVDTTYIPVANKAHEHDNKDVLDKITAADGKLRYNGSDVGLKGDPGKDGTDGKTPVKGTDYWTDADKTEIVNDVLAALPTWAGGSY